MNKIESKIRSFVQHYNEDRYWKYRNIVTNANSKYPKLIKLFMLFYIKKSDAYNNASMGTQMNEGAIFSSILHLPHGLYGIIVSKNAIIGNNCTIFHQVTIGEGSGGAPTIGNNCFIGAGAKIIGNIKIGDNVKIGANAVVVEDIPSDCTVVMNKPRIIIKNEEVL